MTVSNFLCRVESGLKQMTLSKTELATGFILHFSRHGFSIRFTLINKIIKNLKGKRKTLSSKYLFILKRYPNPFSFYLNLCFPFLLATQLVMIKQFVKLVHLLKFQFIYKQLTV